MLYGKIVVIKRSGADGAQFPLTTSNCLFGRSNDCDIRIQLPNVSREHCRVSVAENGEVFLTNLSTINPITVNTKYIESTVKLIHGDVFTIIDRSFRFEVPSQTGKSPAKSPGKNLKNSLVTPIKDTPNKGIDTSKNVDLNETFPLKPLSPSNRKSLGVATPKISPGVRALTPQPAKASKPNTPRHNSTPADMKQTMKILSPKSKPPQPKSAEKPKKSRVQSPSPVRNNIQTGRISRAAKSPTNHVPSDGEINAQSTNLTQSIVETTDKTTSISASPSAKTSAKSPGRPKSSSKTPAKSPGRPASLKTPAESPDRPASASGKTPADSPARSVSPSAKKSAKSPGRPASPSAKTAVKSPGRSASPAKTPAKSPGRPASSPKTAAKSPGRPASPSTKTPAKSPGRPASHSAKTPAKSPGRPASPSAKTPAKSLGRPASPSAETPAKSPGRPASPSANTPAKSPGRPASPSAKTDNSPGRPASPSVRTPAKSPGRPASPSAKTPAKSPGRPASPSTKTPAKSPGRPASPSAKTPTKSPGRPASPSTKTPAKSPGRPASPSNKTPAKSPGRPASPSTKTPAKSPGRPASPSTKTPAKSPGRPASPSTKTPAKSPGRPASPSTKTPAKSPGQVKVKSSGKRKSSENIAPSAKKKRISFGPQLSPEMFDQKLPPITPVRRGTAPRRLSEPINVASPKSLLKRKSMATFRTEQTIVEESPKKKTPKKRLSTPKVKKSPQSSPKVLSSEETSKAASPKTTPKTKSPKLTPQVPAESATVAIKSSAKSPKSPIKRTSPKATPKKQKSPKHVSHGNQSETKPNEGDTSYTGIEELMKTPKVATSTPKTGKKGRPPKAVSMNLVGVKNLLKTPKNKLTDVSFSGISAIFKTPEAEDVKHTMPKSAKKKTPTPKRSPKSLKKTPRSLKRSPSSAIKNAVAIRAVHGKAKTPKLPTNLWSDIVKKGIAETGVAKQRSAEKPIKVVQKKVKTPKSMKKKMPPKTPRTKAANNAPTTGHIDSPATIVIRKKLLSTPAPLPKRGRKSIGLTKKKIPNKSRLSGVADLFKTPSPANTPELSGTPHSLYADLPETPNGPGEMMVSPMSSAKRKSVPTPKLAGLKNLFKESKKRSEAKLGGVKQLLATPKPVKSPASPSGVKEMFETPKVLTPKLKMTKSSSKKISAKKSSKVSKTPIIRRGKKRPASPEAVEPIVEAPAKRSRRGPAMKSPAKLNKITVKNSAKKSSNKSTESAQVGQTEEEKVIVPTPDVPKIVGGRRTLPKLKTTPKAQKIKSRGKRQSPPADTTKKNAGVRKSRRGQKTSPPKKTSETLESKEPTPVKSPFAKKSLKKSLAKGKSLTTDIVSQPVEVKIASGKKLKSPIKEAAVEKPQILPVVATEVNSVKKLQRGGKRKRSVSSTEMDTPSKKPVQEEICLPAKEKTPAKSPKQTGRQTRGKAKLATPKKSPSHSIGKGRKTVAKQVNSPVKPTVKRSAKGKAAKVSTPQKIDTPVKVTVDVEEEVLITESSLAEATVTKQSSKRATRGKASKTASVKKAKTPLKLFSTPNKTDVDAAEKVVTPKKSNARKTRGKKLNTASPEIKKSEGGEASQNSATEKSMPTPKKATPAKKVTRARKTVSANTAKLEEKQDTIQMPVENPGKTASPIKSTPVKKSSKRKGISLKEDASPPKVSKVSKKAAKGNKVEKPVGPSPAKPTKRGTRRNPQPKTPAKLEVQETVDPTPTISKAKVTKKSAAKSANTVSPKQKTPAKRVTRSRR